MPDRPGAIYARFSTDLQNDRSIADQIAVCEGYAARAGIAVVRRYEDRARSSATVFGRDGLLAMVADARAGAFEVIVVEALDRISRNPADLHALHQALDFAGIAIEEVGRGRADAIGVAVSAIVGQMFLDGLRDKTRRGLAGVVRDGRSAGGRAYGYAPVPGRAGELAIVPEEAATIRRIFADYAAGRSTREIAMALNAEGVPSPRGSVWRASLLTGNRSRHYGILLNDLYRGERVWNRVRMVRDPATGRRVSRTNAPGDWQRQNVPDLRIVPEDLWRAAHRRLDANRWQGRGRARAPVTPLAGLLRCAHCGSTITIRSRRATGAVHAMCTGAGEAGLCDTRGSVRLDRIEAEVLNRLASVLRDPAYVGAYVAAYHAECRRLAEAQGGPEALARAAALARTAFDRAERLWLDGISEGAEALDRLRRLRDDRDRAEAAAKEAARAGNVVRLRPDATRRYLDALDALGPALAGLGDAREPVTILRDLISEARITRDGARTQVEIFGRLSALIPGASAAEMSGSVGVFLLLSHTVKVA